MAEEFLEEIYEKSGLLWQIKEIVEKTRIGEGHSVKMNYNALLPDLTKIYRNYKQHDISTAQVFGFCLQEIGKVGNDISLIGDKLERVILPLLEKDLAFYGGINVKNEEEDYRFESTISGFLTMKSLKKNCYFHSTIDPMWEARKMAEYIFDIKKNEYAIWGCGLGYLIYQLFLVSEKSAKINVFEADGRMIEYAKKYGVLDWVPEENLQITVGNDVLPFLECAQKENTGWHIFSPEFDSIPHDVKDIMMELQLEYKTHYTFRQKIDINFCCNMRTNAKMITEFDYSGYGKEYVVVAAGPSLDETLDFLRDSQGKRTIVAVGTVFRKLLNLGITPDMVVVMDPQERTYKQLEGLENENIPLLIDIAAYWKFAAYYQGDKYLIPFAHTDYTYSVLKERKCEFWRAGGTVTSLALEAAIQFGAEKIFLLGVDLSYPDGMSHAADTMDCTQLEVQGMKTAEGVSGKTVYTDEVFLSYHGWIENRIEETPHILYYNLSKIGIKIKGTKPWE